MCADLKILFTNKITLPLLLLLSVYNYEEIKGILFKMF